MVFTYEKVWTVCDACAVFFIGHGSQIAKFFLPSDVCKFANDFSIERFCPSVIVTNSVCAEVLRFTKALAEFNKDYVSLFSSVSTIIQCG